MKPQPVIDGGWEGPPEWALFWKENADGLSPEGLAQRCPYGKPGDLLWCRETWRSPGDRRIAYQADGRCGAMIGDGAGGHLFWYHGWLLGAEGRGERLGDTFGESMYGDRWKPSIHMPRWASRLTLELTQVWVERKRDISVEDAVAEGIEPVLTGTGEQCGWLNYLHAGEGTGYCTDPCDSYATLTDSINGPGSWAANDWVWALSFLVHQQNVDAFLATKETA